MLFTMNYLRPLLSIITMSGPMYAATITFVGTENSGDTFVYHGSIQHNQKIETGNFLVIYDIAVLLSGTGPANWIFTRPLNATGLANDAAIPDALFTYDGPTITGVQGGTALGTFYMNGRFTGQTEGSYLARAVRVGSGNNANTLLDQSDSITIPAVPEPSTTALLITGAALVIAHRLHKRRLSCIRHTESAVQ
jgi:hypothetical protein